MHFELPATKIAKLIPDNVALHETMTKLRSMCYAHAGALRLMYGVVQIVENPEGKHVYTPLARYCDPIITVKGIQSLEMLAQSMSGALELEVFLLLLFPKYR